MQDEWDRSLFATQPFNSSIANTENLINVLPYVEIGAAILYAPSKCDDKLVEPNFSRFLVLAEVPTVRS